jgi:hypothetical protein
VFPIVIAECPSRHKLNSTSLLHCIPSFLIVQESASKPMQHKGARRNTDINLKQVKLFPKVLPTWKSWKMKGRLGWIETIPLLPSGLSCERLRVLDLVPVNPP